MILHSFIKKTEKTPRKEVQRAYDDLAEEYQLARELIQARATAGLTQEQVAERMHIKKHSPSIATLRKYARAVGCKLEIHLVPAES